MQLPSFVARVMCSRLARALTLVGGVSLAACGDSGPTTSDDGSTSEGDATTEDTTGGASTGDASTSSSGSTTEEPLLLCDGSTVENLFDCQPCTECGSWDRASVGNSLPAAVQCTLEGIVNGDRVSSTQIDCNLGMCTEDRFATTLEGSVLDQLRVLDMNNVPTNYLTTVEYSLRELSYFESCLATTDQAEIADCVLPNNWFTQSLGQHESVVCP